MKLRLNILKWEKQLADVIMSKGIVLEKIESDDENFDEYEFDASNLVKLVEFAFEIGADMTIGGGHWVKKKDVFLNY